MGCKGFLPVEKHFDRLRPLNVMKQGNAAIAVTSAYIPGLPVITAPDTASATAALLRLLDKLLLPGVVLMVPAKFTALPDSSTYSILTDS